MFGECGDKVGQCIYVSATPGDYEMKKAENHIAEQVIRPTGIPDPIVEIRPTKNQMKTAISALKKAKKKKRTSVCCYYNKTTCRRCCRIFNKRRA